GLRVGRAVSPGRPCSGAICRRRTGYRGSECGRRAWACRPCPEQAPGPAGRTGRAGEDRRASGCAWVVLLPRGGVGTRSATSAAAPGRVRAAAFCVRYPEDELSVSTAAPATPGELYYTAERQT